MALPNRLESEMKRKPWSGKILSIQPRIRLTRSFDQRSHNYLGYTLTDSRQLEGKNGTFAIGIGKDAQAKHRFQAGDVVSGKSEEVQDPRSELSEYYKTSELKK